MIDNQRSRRARLPRSAERSLCSAISLPTSAGDRPSGKSHAPGAGVAGQTTSWSDGAPGRRRSAAGAGRSRFADRDQLLDQPQRGRMASRPCAGGSSERHGLRARRAGSAACACATSRGRRDAGRTAPTDAGSSPSSTRRGARRGLAPPRRTRRCRRPSTRSRRGPAGAHHRPSRCTPAGTSRSRDRRTPDDP